MTAADILAYVAVRDSAFFDSLYLDYLAEEPALLARFASSYRRLDAWPALAARRRRADAALPLWQALAGAHERWGAPEETRRALADLAEGRAVAVVTGQQPDALGGPLFTLHKVLTAMALARRFEVGTGTRAVPVFWAAGEDSDFDEVRTVRFLGEGLEAVEASLPESARVPGGLVGDIPCDALRETWERARRAWRSEPGATVVGAWLDRAGEHARDLGDAQAVLLLAALGQQGLVVLDPRLPAFRDAARPLYERYLERHAEVREAVDLAGRGLEERGLPRAIQPAQSEFSLFAIEGATRVKLDAASAGEALARGRPLAPNVVLRPLVQDALLPAAFLVAGPGEVAYLAQLKEVYEVLGVPMSAVFPRLTATWLPAAATELVRTQGVEPWDLVRDTDRALRELGERALPAPLRAEFERRRGEASAGLGGLAEAAAAMDVSLPQLVESARAKIDFQYGRILEGLVSKARARLEGAHPEVGRLRQVLLPGGRPQERRLAWLDLVARGGPGILARGRDLAEDHVERALAGRASHALVALAGGDAE